MLDRIVLAAARRYVPQGWAPTPAAPSTFAALCAAWSPDAPLTVYDGASGATIYAAPEINHAFRAWHDACHVALGADFTVRGEMRTAALQLRQAAALGADARTLALLRADTVGQVQYFRAFGRFVDDQRAFVARYLKG